MPWKELRRRSPRPRGRLIKSAWYVRQHVFLSERVEGWVYFTLSHHNTSGHKWMYLGVQKKNIIMMMFLVIKPWRFRLGEGQGWEHEGFVVGIPDLTRSWNDMLMHVYNFATVSFHYSHQHKQKLKLKSSQCRPQDTFVSLLVALAFSHSPCQVGYFLIDNILDKFFFQKKKNSSKAVRTCTRQPLH